MAAAKPASKAGQEGAVKTIPGIRVMSKTEGFRRGGRAWSSSPAEVAVATFSKRQIADIRAEQKLIVVDIDIPVDGAAESAE